MASSPQFVPPSSPVPPPGPSGSAPSGYAPSGYAPSGYARPIGDRAEPAPHYPQPYPALPQPTTYVLQPPPRPQRPAVIAMSASMTVTASTLWVCALALGWLLAAAGQARLQADQDFDGQVLILLNRFSARLLDGLAIPLFGLPAIAFVTAFLLLSGRRWAQVIYTLLGVATVGWLLWWLQSSWTWAVAPIAYVAISVAIVWTPAAVRWFGRSRR